MPKVFIEQSSYPYALMFLDAGFEVVFDKEMADLVCFTGGEDVSPSMYKETKHPKTYPSPSRDTREFILYQECLDRRIPMVGICRGGQFLNVACGGRMYQHVTNHTRNHFIDIVGENKSIEVTSTHHQMMIPGNGAQVIATANEGGTKEFMKDNSIVTLQNSTPDIEVVYYKKFQCLCFQPHPEFIGESLKELKDFFFECVNKYLKPKGE